MTSAIRFSVLCAATVAMGAIATPAPAQSGGFQAQLSTDSQRMGGQDGPSQLQTDGQRRMSQMEAMQRNAVQQATAAGVAGAGGGYQPQGGAISGYGNSGYGDGVEYGRYGGAGESAIGTSLGAAAAVDAVNAAAGVTNRAILNRGGGQLRLDQNGIIRNGGQDDGKRDAGGR